jgi:hypothetical protein
LLDLLIFPIHIESGRELVDLPGLLATSAPQRVSSRLRSQDVLVLFLTLSGNAPLSPPNQQDLLKNMADLYFRSQGSVTAGMREMLIHFNQVLLDRNMKLSREGIREVGVLNAVVIRGEIAYVLHAGPTCTLATDSKQVQTFRDEDVPLRGLGLGKMIIPQFHTLSVEPGCLLILSPEPAKTWSTGLLGALPRQTLDVVRRSLMVDLPLQLQAVVIKLQEGKGQVRMLRPRVSQTPGEGASLAGTVAIPTEAPQAVMPPIREATPPEVSTGTVNKPLPRKDDSSPAAQEAIVVQPVPAEPPVTEKETISQKPVGMYLTGERVKPEEKPVKSNEQAAAVAAPKEQPVRKGLFSALSGRFAKAREWLSQPAFGSAQVESRKIPADKVATPSSPPLQKPSQGDRVSTARVLPEEFKQPAQSTAKSETAVISKAPKKAPAWLAPVARAFQSFGKLLQAGLTRLGNGISTLIERSLPETTPGFSSALMTFIAVAVPVAVVAVATTFYLNSGRGQQHQAYYAQAQQMAELTGKQQDINARRSGWQQVLAVLDKADSYGSSDSSRALRRQVQVELDTIEGVTRLPFLPAFPDRLDSTVNITRIISNLSDIYLLDGNGGRVFRLFRTAQGYDLDPKFMCGPVQRGGQGVGKIIDIAPIPANNDINPGGPAPAVIGMDASANLAYCAPGLPAPLTRAITPPGSGWGKLVGFSIFQNSLYVLDTLNSLVWKYDSLDGVVFSGDPILYFGRTIPPLADVIDIGAYQNDLYLLRSDGKMVTCVYATPGISTTRCNDPNPYGDTRSGREPSPLVFLDAKFDQVQIVRPPDPSIYILDVSVPSIYHFSLRLNLQKQYRVMSDPDHPLPHRSPSAFVITSGRQVLLAYANQVYLSELP